MRICVGALLGEREGRIEEREGRFSGAMEVTETAVEGGVASKKKVKKVGKREGSRRQTHW